MSYDDNQLNDRYSSFFGKMIRRVVGQDGKDDHNEYYTPIQVAHMIYDKGMESPADSITMRTGCR